MAYDYYENPCDEEIQDPVCDECGDEVELGRVRTAAYLHQSAYAAVMANPTSAGVWNTAKDAGKLKIIPQVRGSFDGGSPVEVDGFGDNATKVIGSDYSLNYKDPSYKGNYDFYESIKGRSDWHLVFRTETLTRVTSKPVTIAAKDPIEEDANSQVVWDVEVKWRQKNLHKPFATPVSVFDCVGVPQEYYIP